MSYFFTETEETVKELFKKFADDRLISLRRELDEKNDFPAELFFEIGKKGLCRVMVPEKYGGMGNNICMLSALAVEELSRGEGGVGLSFAANGIATIGLINYGNEEQKERYLPAIADGKIMTAFALTEPQAGSDSASIKTQAVKKGDRYVLNGVKRFISNAGIADIYLVIAVTDPELGRKGHSAFIVEKGTPGLIYGKTEDKMGLRSSITRRLNFKDCEIPASNMVGQPGQGFYISLGIFDRTRICIGAQALGIARAAFEESIVYARKRKQFGQTIQSFQAIQFKIADMATQIEATRNLIYHAARNADKGDKDMKRLASMAKMFASDMAVKVTCDAVQIFGGAGYMKDFPVEKLYRDAKVTQIYEGTNEIQRIVIANSFIKEEQ